MLERKILKWMNGGNTGLSSKTIAYMGIGEKYHWPAPPSDPSDFNRCLELIKKIPELKPVLREVRMLSDQWKSLVDNWDALEACFIEEVGENWEKGPHVSAAKTYKMMKELGL